MNRDVIRQVGDLTRDHQNIIGVSFNFYNPYPATSARSWKIEKSGIVAAAFCRECGYLFAYECSLAFDRNPEVIIDMIRTYRRFI
ncbi:MAG: hypothetical protein PHI41_10295 [Erysipelotrichaceae bacterium]|nr:hypothetical protein [Erysipelotrichaceae bacterium]